MKPLLITIQAQSADPTPSPDVISDLLSAVLRGLHIHAETVTVSLVEATATRTFRLPRKRGTKSSILS